VALLTSAKKVSTALRAAAWISTMAVAAILPPGARRNSRRRHAGAKMMGNRNRMRRLALASGAALSLVSVGYVGVDASAAATTVVHYKSTSLDQYHQKWSNKYGPGELAAGGTLAGAERSGNG